MLTRLLARSYVRTFVRSFARSLARVSSACACNFSDTRMARVYLRSEAARPAKRITIFHCRLCAARSTCEEGGWVWWPRFRSSLLNKQSLYCRTRARDAVSALESSYLLLRIPSPHASPRPSFSCVITSTPEFIFTTELLAKSDFILRSFPLLSPLSPGPTLSFYTLSAVSLVSSDVRSDVTLA